MPRLSPTDLLEKRIAAVGGPAAWARNHGISQQYVCDVRAGRKRPGPKILAALGLKREDSFTVVRKP